MPPARAQRTCSMQSVREPARRARGGAKLIGTRRYRERVSSGADLAAGADADAAPAAGVAGCDGVPAGASALGDSFRDSWRRRNSTRSDRRAAASARLRRCKTHHAPHNAPSERDAV
eukprot:IDg15493t1